MPRTSALRDWRVVRAITSLINCDECVTGRPVNGHYIVICMTRRLDKMTSLRWVQAHSQYILGLVTTKNWQLAPRKLTINYSAIISISDVYYRLSDLASFARLFLQWGPCFFSSCVVSFSYKRTFGNRLRPTAVPCKLSNPPPPPPPPTFVNTPGIRLLIPPNSSH